MSTGAERILQEFKEINRNPISNQYFILIKISNNITN